jgi:hypothetical protein
LVLDRARPNTGQTRISAYHPTEPILRMFRMAPMGQTSSFVAPAPNGREAPLAAIPLTAIDLTSISAKEFVEKRIDFAILVLDRDPMRRSGELFEPISHAGGF